MNREATLGVLAVVLLLGAAVLVLLAPGAVAEADDDLRPSHLQLHEPRVAAGDVAGETAELTLDVRMEHGGGPAENVTLEVQVIDTDTGLVETTVRKPLGTITGDREVRTRVNVSVARQGGYRMDLRLYEDGERIATERTEVSGVESLTPGYARTSIEFHRFGTGSDDLPVVTVSVEGTDGNRTTLRTQTYLTNRGDEPAGDLELVLLARQVESNVVADRVTVQIDEIGPGETSTPTASLEVPADYNYYLDAILHKDDVIVGNARGSAMLDPTRPVPENTTTEDVEFDAGDFTSPTPFGEETPMPTAVSGGPGFGAAVAVLALVLGGLAAARRRP